MSEAPLGSAASAPRSTVDTVLAPRLLLPVAPENVVSAGVSVALAGGAIADIGEHDAIAARYPNARFLNFDHHLLMPGLVNAHGHLAMALLRGLGESQALTEWLENTIWPLEGRWVDEAFVADGTSLAIAEMVASGTTAAADMYFFPEVAAETSRQAGFRLQAAFPIIEVRNAYSKDANECFAKGLALHDRFRNDDLITTCFGPHSGYAVERQSLERIAMLADEMEVGTHIHLHETMEEVATAKRQTGTTWIRVLDAVGLLNENLQAVHMTAVTDDDIQLVAERGAHVIHCPHSNMKLASGVCPLAKFQAAGAVVGLGTDGAASNNGLDMFAEARLAALLAKSSSGDPTTLPAPAAVAMATLGSAKALGMDDRAGSIEIGKRADLIAIDLAHPTMQPLHDAHSQLIHCAAGPRVTHTFIDGQCVFEDGRWLTLDIDETLQRAERWRERLAA